jgi:hypothetical protein
LTVVQHFHTLGSFYTGNGGGTWCSDCQARGYRCGGDIRINNVEDDAQQEFASWYVHDLKHQLFRPSAADAQCI